MRLPRIGVGAAAALALRALRRASAACADRLPPWRYQVCGAAPCAWGGLRRKRSPRWYAAVPSGGSHAAVAVAAPRAPPESKPSVCSAIRVRACALSGSLDIVDDMCICELWARLRTVELAPVKTLDAASVAC